MQRLLDLVYAPRSAWGEEPVREALSAALQERYPRVSDLRTKRNEERRFQLRVNADTKDSGVPYAALIAPEQELSGGYGGMSFVLFPGDDEGTPALISMVIGTNGLAPDDAVLGKPGHARKAAAIAAWLNKRLPGSAWAKHDPVRIDISLPTKLEKALAGWSKSLNRYDKVIYATFAPPTNRTPEGDAVVRDALSSLCDLFFDERRLSPKAAVRDDAERVRRAWMSRLFPWASDEHVLALLKARRFVIVEGPPGTGKTELAGRLLQEQYKGRGRVIQFHPGTTYETFVGGLAPRDGGALGFTFRPVKGHLMEAADEAIKTPHLPYLLVIDEINRADMAKVLGEAIYLFEPGRTEREVTLAHDFEHTGRTLKLPENLHVLGTMNSADRSIAILDVAVRRRFAFTQLWPQLDVVERLSGKLMRNAFQDLMTLFVDHAGDDSLALVPGHAYFLGADEEAHLRLSTGLRPLLDEYLAQGYVAGFADELRAYLDRLP